MTIEVNNMERKALKWNVKTNDYDIYRLPFKASAYESDLHTIVACARCEKELSYGDAYTSRQIHTEMGFGYMVCRECNKQEWNLERLS